MFNYRIVARSVNEKCYRWSYAGNGELTITRNHMKNIDYMKEWLSDCFPWDEDEILELTDEETLCAVSRYYDGGIAKFMRDGGDL